MRKAAHNPTINHQESIPSVKYSVFLWNIILLVLIIGGCDPRSVSIPSIQMATWTPEQAHPTQTLMSLEKIDATSTPTPVAMVTPTSTVSEPANLAIWLSLALPDGIRAALSLPPEIIQVSQSEEANLLLGPAEVGLEQNDELPSSTWVYALVAPFPTVMDGVSLPDIKDCWVGKPVPIINGNPILMAPGTYQAFQGLWGPSLTGAMVVEKDKLLDTAWKMPSWAIIPFDELEPRWKVLRVNGMSPLDKGFNLDAYPLNIKFVLTVDAQYEDYLVSQVRSLKLVLPSTNRDPNKMTVLVLSGTTALSRNTSAKMEENGIAYPARDIGSWLREADLAHISNEVPLFEQCPPALPVRKEMRFCGSPRYLDLFKDIGVDLVELTGNHELDYGVDAFRETLNLYRQNDLSYYGGGENLEEARKPLLIEHNGNRLAFIGCNAVGPESDLATKNLPGAASCDMDKLENQVRDLRRQGYLPVVTFQHFEFGIFDGYKPQSAQRIDFQRIAAAGALIVSGSQAHYPQTMTFIGNNFVHYGLGNLFFDQMDKENRREFIDRHIFYNGRYISTELLTAMLEDYARPRPMTLEERVQLLQDIFGASEWQKANAK
jgi:poly-gamma-glutamate synthesis protein (capsule biosynthesis protein)